MTSKQLNGYLAAQEEGMNLHVCVLVVDREPNQRAASAAALKERGFQVLEAGSVTEAVGMASRTVNLTVILAELEPEINLARAVYQQTESIMEQRRGLFLVAADTLPRSLPRKLQADFFADRAVPIFLHPLDWAGEVSRLLREHSARLAG